MAPTGSNRSHLLVVAHGAARRGVSLKILVISLTIITLLTIIQATPIVGTSSNESQENTTNATSHQATTTQDASMNRTSGTAATTTTTSTPAATTTTTTAATAPAATKTTSATTTTATTTTTTTIASSEPVVTVREPSEQEINEARKIIQEVASSIRETNPHRLIMNKPLPSSLQPNYAPDSLEARVSDATSHFGLSLMRMAMSEKRDNTLVSPLSLQILMNIILLGTKDQSSAQLELAKALGYEDVASLSLKKSSNSSGADDDRARMFRPHVAMHSVVDSIMKAIHLSVEDRHLQQLLLNSNPTISTGDQLEAHLQTTNRDNDIPLSGQLNFTLANLMLTNKDLLQTSAEYEKELQQYYNVKVEQFSRASQAPTQKAGSVGADRPLHVRVNEWVKNITRGQIGDLVDEATLSDPLLALVLINAANFKGQWLHTFNGRLTEDRTFYNLGVEPKDTKFMRQNGAFGYAEFRAHGTSQPPMRKREAGPGLAQDDVETVLTEDGNAPGAGRTSQEGTTTVIEYQGESEMRRQRLVANINCSALMLPFSLNDGQEMSMVVLLPNKRDGLDELMTKLDVATLNEIYKAIEDTQTVQVELPKFSMEASHDVRSLLEQMGVKRIFDENTAELARMFVGAGKAPVSVGKVIHKAKIAVDEQGAEAAAASLASVVMRSSIRVTVPTFTADHPFLYIIRHSRCNMPLFMGQVRRF